MNNKRLKILLKTGSFPNVSETFITNHLKILNENNIDFQLLVGKKNEMEFSSQYDLIVDSNFLQKTVELKNYDISNLYKKFIFVLKVLIESPSFFKYLKTFLLRKYGYEGRRGKLFYYMYQIKNYIGNDIVHIQFATNSEPFLTLKKFDLLINKLIVSCHGHDVHFTEENYHERIEVLRDLFVHSDLVTVNSDYLKRKVIKLGCNTNKVKVIPIPVNTEYFKCNNQKGSELIKVISVGRLIKLKGHIYGIQVIHELKKKGFNVTYEIIGDGEFKTELTNEINKYDLNDDVILSGKQSQDYIRKKLCKSDVFLMTSITDIDNRQEAFGLSTIEAQACGIPVVAFDTGGVSDTIRNSITGFLCKEKDIIDMANKIVLIKNTKGKKVKMGMNARKFVEENFAITYIGKIWSNIYCSFIN